ncbi:hypothetical protein FGM00_06010 [Aggregatimonas sangjinii]|uniref:SGNH/GDSL hydrolase family protein n=1 Tax=Aggregatimonas sangjinii TaxID=2583587 RepID=A0A5B7SM05_9FLAO|nr:hypothetical protein [Aggregatimonas sangjinii]QCW99674.1 hypothetical protein FGM00_06010 [Aggregatimonas sangjinii]
MGKFLRTLIVFAILLGIIGEVVIRTFRLVPDIPERYIDNHGIQRYRPGQSGYYTKAEEQWNVNKYGWLGTHDNEKERTISVIGDSFIENIMNPISCNQGSVLKNRFPEYSFFEAGRSGVTFIEAVEISAILQDEINPKYQLLYLNTADFSESVSEIQRYTDRLQISLETEKLLPAELKSVGLKKILYNIKLLYYLYLRYPIFVEKQNQVADEETTISLETENKLMYQKLFAYCASNYELNRLIFVFHPNTDQRILNLAHEYDIKTISLDSDGDKNWDLGEHDGHWSCYGHEQVSKQVAKRLKEIAL